MAAMLLSELRNCVPLEESYIDLVVINTPVPCLRWCKIQNTIFIYQSDVPTFLFQTMHG